MGMDIYGLNPTQEAGKHFRITLFCWPSVWRYCELAGASVVPKLNVGYSNSGWGLVSHKSRTLAAILRAEIDSGRTSLFVENFGQWMENYPECEGMLLLDGRKCTPPPDHPMKLVSCESCLLTGRVCEHGRPLLVLENRRVREDCPDCIREPK